MSKECPLSYIKAVQCPGPTKISNGNYLCNRGDSICQTRLDGRAFTREKQPTFEAPPPDETFTFNYREPCWKP